MNKSEGSGGQPSMAIDEYVTRAFMEYRLDPTLPEEWQKLTQFLAVRAYSRARRGRRPQWSLARLNQLLNDRIDVWGRNRNITDYSACEVLRTSSRFRARWSNYTRHTIYKRLREAEDRIIGNLETPDPLPVDWRWG